MYSGGLCCERLIRINDGLHNESVLCSGLGESLRIVVREATRALQMSTQTSQCIQQVGVGYSIVDRCIEARDQGVVVVVPGVGVCSVGGCSVSGRSVSQSSVSQSSVGQAIAGQTIGGQSVTKHSSSLPPKPLGRVIEVGEELLEDVWPAPACCQPARLSFQGFAQFEQFDQIVG